MQELTCDLEQLLAENPDVVITMSETGSGIVPMQKFERDWREPGKSGAARVLSALPKRRSPVRDATAHADRQTANHQIKMQGKD